jgi:uncharacterized protein
MTVSMYAISMPIYDRQLVSLSQILSKVTLHCEQKKIDQSVFMGLRLYPDMLPFSRQIQIACDQGKGAAARLAGIEVPRFEDTESNFAELQGRIEKTRDFVRSVSKAAIEASAEREIVMKIGPTEVRMTGLRFLTEFSLPNFYFHLTSAYAILRHNGVELGKRDYLGAL